MDSEPTPSQRQPHTLHAAADLSALLTLVHDVVRKFAALEMGPLLAGREEPADLAQTVVLEILRHADKIEDRGEESTRALAKTMLVRKLADRVRAARTQRRGGGGFHPLIDDNDSASPAAVAKDPARGPASLAAERDLVDHVVALAKRLSARERAVFELRVAGKAHAQIAKALGISADYSQQLLAQAKEKLRRAAPPG